MFNRIAASGVSRDRIEILEVVRAKGTAFIIDVIPSVAEESPKKETNFLRKGISPCASLSRNDIPVSDLQLTISH